MSKISVIITSILSLIVTFIFNYLPDSGMNELKIGSFVATIILWIAVVFVVFADAKKRNKSPGFAGLTLITGGIGGLIYYFVIFREQD